VCFLRYDEQYRPVILIRNYTALLRIACSLFFFPSVSLPCATTIRTLSNIYYLSFRLCLFRKEKY
jgi:hypothetical protein